MLQLKRRRAAFIEASESSRRSLQLQYLRAVQHNPGFCAHVVPAAHFRMKRGQPTGMEWLVVMAVRVN